MSNKKNISLRKRLARHSYIKKVLKIIYFKNDIKEYFHSLRFGFLAKYFPKRHCWLITKPGGIKEMPFKINLRNPFYFNEKSLWLKYYIYNHSSLVAKCYDKYLVREYVKECGCEHILNEIYGVWDSIDEVPWEHLPEEYVLKITNGNSYHVFKTEGQKIDIDFCKNTLLIPAKRRFLIYRASGDLFALKSPQRVICEKLLRSSKSSYGLDDWKFHCFNGEPKYLRYVYDRVVANSAEKGSDKTAFMTVDLEDRTSFYKGAIDDLPLKPSCYEEMLRCARKLSKDFPYVRVDFYLFNDKPVFGELTFTPYGGYGKYHMHNEEALIEMGNCLNLKNISKYTKLNLKNAKNIL